METIIGAIIGGIFTIIAAFITRGIVIRAFINPSYQPGGITKKFVQFFSLFRISNAKYYKVPYEKVVTDESLYISFIYLYDDLTIKMKNKKVYSMYHSIGECKYVLVGGIEYRIMIVDAEFYEYVTVEIRQLS